MTSKLVFKGKLKAEYGGGEVEQTVIVPQEMQDKLKVFIQISLVQFGAGGFVIHEGKKHTLIKPDKLEDIWVEEPSIMEGSIGDLNALNAKLPKK